MKDTVGGTDVAKFFVHGQFRFQMVPDIAVTYGVNVGLPILLFFLQLSQRLTVVTCLKQIGNRKLSGVRGFGILRRTKFQIFLMCFVLLAFYGIEMGCHAIAAGPTHINKTVRYLLLGFKPSDGILISGEQTGRFVIIAFVPQCTD